MRTISFYSYKGGSGRTYALVNIGVALARMGRNVVLLDFDFNAPGLPAKFGGSSFKGIEGGVVDFIWQNWEYISSNFNSKKEPRPIADYCKDIPLPRCQDPDASAPEGRLRYIPCGNAGSQEQYWDRLFSREWLALFDLQEVAEDKIRLFAEDLKIAIQQLQPPPDYLLIDSRAGITPYGGASNLLLADTVACLFGSNPESLEGLEMVLGGLVSANERRKLFQRLFEKISFPPLNVVPVLSRIPPKYYDSLDPQFVATLNKDLCSKFGRRLGFESPINVLHTDIALEGREELRLMQPDGSIHDVLLTHDLLELLVRLAPAEAHAPVDSGLTAGHVEAVRHRLGLPRTGFVRIYPAYDLDPELGVLINLADKRRNVSFKVETFCAMLEDIHKDIVRQSESDRAFAPDEHVAVQQAREKFERAGYNSGQRFGLDLVERVWAQPLGDRGQRAGTTEQEQGTTEKKSATTEEDHLKAWCDFDSRVGWGRLEILSESLQKDLQGRVVGGRITVTKNFLAEGRNSQEADLCSLLEGYMRGVLDAILHGKAFIRHDHNKCMQFDHTRTSCDFDFRVDRDVATETKIPQLSESEERVSVR